MIGVKTGDEDSRALIEVLLFKQWVKLAFSFEFMLSLTNTNYIIKFILYKL